VIRLNRTLRTKAEIAATSVSYPVLHSVARCCTLVGDSLDPVPER